MDLGESVNVFAKAYPACVYGKITPNCTLLRWKYRYLNALYDSFVSRWRHFLLDCAIAIEVECCGNRQQSAVVLCNGRQTVSKNTAL